MDCVNSSIMIPDWIKNGEIPHWLLVELLIRLPRKSIFRFKLVSKKWLSTILAPYFVRAYCSRALLLSRYKPWTLFSERMYTKARFCNTFLDYDMWEGSSSLHPFSLPKKPHFYDIHEVSNGLVLFNYYGIMQVLNPATGQRLSLPPHNARAYCCPGFHANVEDGVLLSFNVFIHHMHEVPKNNETLKFEVYFSETDEWVMFNVHMDKPTPIEFLRSPTTVLNGFIHWIIYKSNGLIAYDPKGSPNEARIIALPADSSKYYYHDMCLAYDGKLRYCRMKYPELEDQYHSQEGWSINIWVMNDYNTGDWCLQHRVSYPDIQLCDDLTGDWDSYIMPLSFHPYDSDIVYLQFKENLFTYNLKTRNIEVEEFINHRIYGYAYFLLMIPLWPITHCHSSIRGWDGGSIDIDGGSTDFDEGSTDIDGDSSDID